MSTTIGNIKDRLFTVASGAKRYSVIIFFLFLAGIYGFLVLRIVTLNQATPDQAVIATKLKTAGVPHIDQSVLDKIQKLQDNSVEVKTFFDQGRDNPFQEQ